MKLQIPQRWIDELASNPDSDLSAKIRKSGILSRVAEVNAHELKVSTTSKIGTRLMEKFKSRIAAVPCSACKESMRRLNRMTPDYVEENRASLVDEIYENSQHAGVSWLAKASMAVDKMLTDGLTMHIVIGLWLDEAVAAERESTKQKGEAE